MQASEIRWSRSFAHAHGRDVSAYSLIEFASEAKGIYLKVEHAFEAEVFYLKVEHSSVHSSSLLTWEIPCAVVCSRNAVQQSFLSLCVALCSTSRIRWVSFPLCPEPAG